MSNTKRNPLSENTTFTLHRHLDTDRDLRLEVLELVRGRLPEAEDHARQVWPDDEADRYRVPDLDETRERHVRSLVAEVLREWVKELVVDAARRSGSLDGPDILVRALLVAALREVEWGALAGWYIDKVREEGDPAEDGTEVDEVTGFPVPTSWEFLDEGLWWVPSLGLHVAVSLKDGRWLVSVSDSESGHVEGRDYLADPENLPVVLRDLGRMV